MKKTAHIKINADTLLNELLFCAARYCVGRHTYVSSYARTYWSIISENREKFNQDRLEFFAKDILTEVSQYMFYHHNISVDNNINCAIRNDAYTLLAGYLEKHPDVDKASTKFNIDCLSGNVTTEPLENPDKYCCFMRYDYDLSEWVKLAKLILGPSHKVTFKHPEMGVRTAECVQIPDWDKERGWHIKYTPAGESWKSFVPNEWITKIEEI